MIELLFIIVILGILSSIAIPKITGYKSENSTKHIQTVHTTSAETDKTEWH